MIMECESELFKQMCHYVIITQGYVYGSQRNDQQYMVIYSEKLHSCIFYTDITIQYHLNLLMVNENFTSIPESISVKSANTVDFMKRQFNKI